MSKEINVDADYAALWSVLSSAYEQSSSGKGKDRHANGKPFLEQPIMEIGRMVGIGYQLGQAMKKAQEAGGMASRGQFSAARAELLGAINYLAAAHIQIGETEQAQADQTPRPEQPPVRFAIAPAGVCQSCARSTDKSPSENCQTPDRHGT